MKLVELQPSLFRYETRYEDITKVDPAFTWDHSRNQYLNANGQEWHNAGAPTLTLPGEREYLITVQTLPEAHGIMFLCPKCYQENSGEVSTHHIHMPFASRGVDLTKHTHQWNVTGNDYNDLSTTPSYMIVGGCGWHGYITNGEVSIL